MAREDTKICPYCSEEIKAGAIKCKFCGEFLQASGGSPTRRPKHKPEVTWEYHDWVVPLSQTEIAGFPRLGKHVDIRTYVYSGVLQDVNSIDAGARLGLWLHLSPLLLGKQKEFAEEGWEPEPARYGQDCLQMELISSGSCLMLILLAPFWWFPPIDYLIPKEYYMPTAVIFPMRRRVARE